MNIFIDTSATREYVLSADSERSIIWTLGAIDSRLILHIIARNQTSEGTEADRFFSHLVDFVRFGLKGATGIDVPLENVDVPYIGKRQAVSEDFLKRLRPEVLIELGREIRLDNILTDEERKKFSGPSQSSETRD